MPAEPAGKEEAKPDAQPAASAPGGLKAWLPLILTVILMPVLAYAMTTYVLLPKLRSSMGAQTVEARETGNEHGGAAGGESNPAKETGKPKTKVPLSKVIVNVSGSLGTRMLLASFTLAGNASDLKM